MTNNKNTVLLNSLDEAFKVTYAPDKGMFSLRPKPGKTVKDKEIDALFEHLKMLFERFKFQLKQKGIYVDSYSLVLDNEGLAVRISEPTYFDLFMQQLTDFFVDNEMILNKPKESCDNPEAALSDNAPQFNPSPFTIDLLKRP